MTTKDQIVIAEKELTYAENRLANLRKSDEDFRNKLRKSLFVGERTHCNVGILPSGDIAVHVWVESSAKPNQLHIITPEYLSDYGVIITKEEAGH